MQYRTLLDYGMVEKMQEEMSSLSPGVWLVDLDPDCDKVLLGPFDTVAEAHDNRDYIWHYGDRYGRYLWVVTPTVLDKLRGRTHLLQHIEVGIDTLPLEVTSMKIKLEGIDGWMHLPRKKRSVK
jgi:hypothetical protein